jgi:hypothetical protein
VTNSIILKAWGCQKKFFKNFLSDERRDPPVDKGVNLALGNLLLGVI